MYDPTLGQFLSRDPLEAATGDAYGYAANNPVDLTDPTGLAPSINFSISNDITAVPQPQPGYNPPTSCRGYGLCDALATAPPGAHVRCSATFGCRYRLNGQETWCTGYGGRDCGYRPQATLMPDSDGDDGFDWDRVWDLGADLISFVEGCAVAVNLGKPFIVAGSTLGPLGTISAFGSLCVGGGAIGVADPNPPGF